MKKLITVFIGLTAWSAASAAVVFIDLDDVAIPNTFEGIYINVLTGDTEYSFPTDFNDAPWINFFVGGTGIANSELLRPWASQPPLDYDPSSSGHYFLNVAPGTTIDGSGVFVGGETVSELHMGVAGDQFQSGVKGYLAFEYMANSSSGVAYGWLSFSPNIGGEGFSFDLAYSDTPGEAITVGAIPEPASFAALAGAFGLGFAAYRRRRSVA